MNLPRGSEVWMIGIAALGVASAALVSVGWWAGVRPTRMARIRDLARAKTELAQLDRDARRFDPHWRAIEAIGHGPPPPLELFAQAVPGVPAPVVSGEQRQPLNDRWEWRRVELACSEIPLDSLIAFAHTCSTLRPPWRVSRLRIEPLDIGSTRARAMLTLESVMPRSGGAGR